MRRDIAVDNMGSMAAYMEKPSRSMGDYANNAYRFGNDIFVSSPYKGWTGIGAILGGFAGAIGGPLGVAIGATLGASVFGGYSTAYHWLWGRKKRDERILNGMSVGRKLRDHWETGKW